MPFIYRNLAVSPQIVEESLLTLVADLIGIPLRITIGAKGLDKGCIELRSRRDGKTDEVPLGEAVTTIQSIIAQAVQG